MSFLYRTTMQHLAYQPLLPAGNKYLQQKWDKASYDLHRRKVGSNMYLSFSLSSSFVPVKMPWPPAFSLFKLTFFPNQLMLCWNSILYYILQPFSASEKAVIVLFVVVFSPKVKSAKPTINMTPPKTYGHLALKLKKQKVALCLSSSELAAVVSILKTVKPQTRKVKWEIITKSH